ncbi:MAG: lytic murein transglycosylase [Pseudorhodobacter sp.]|nr:lytic murein transglycosylase [Pseudorhodobacter sp.]
MQDIGKTLGAVLGLGLSAASAAPVDLGKQPGAAGISSQGDPVLVQASASGSQAGLQRWIAGFRGRALSAGISASVFDAAMTGASYDPDIIRRDRTQSEFTKTIWDYLDTAASDARVTNGRAALAKHRSVLERIEARYGVEKEVVTAIWGLESAYGTFRGTTPTLGALATLAYDGRRGAFFEAQLLAGLKILQSGDTTPARMQGSWAGAMGHTQFMPTSYLDHAVDFTGDGKRDIWSDDPTDALASTAAYLASFGWTKGMPWGVEVTLPQGFDYAETGERVKKPVAGWQAQGVRQVDGADLPDHGPASILLPAGAQGVAFLIFANFQVIERYNSADAYVIAVGHLADRIGGAAPFKAGWPRQDRALSFDERIELQERLTRAGFSTEGIDGKIGPNTIAAVRGFQRAKGLIPDGYASLEILKRLR